MEPSSFHPSSVPRLPAWEVVPVVEPAPVLEALPVRPARPTTMLEAFQVMLRAWEAVVETALGLIGLPLGLAFLAAVPLLNFMALGYLLEAGGRIARSGQFRDGFFGIRRAGRVSALLGGAWLSILPVLWLSSMVRSAELIDPDSTITRNWRIGLTCALVLVVPHLVLACLWGGKLRHFLLPVLHPVYAILALARGNPLVRARDGVWTFFVDARPWYFFWLGLRGALGALVYLAVPITLLAVGWKAPLLGVLGFLLLLPVLVVLPMLQMNLAATNRFVAVLDLAAVVRLYLRAPWACVIALFITLLFALPLYLLKVQLVPRDALAFPALIFIAFIWPARLLTGWVYGRAMRRTRRSHWFWWMTAALPVPALVILYAFFVWLSQYVSWFGVSSLYEQHAFLLPVPFTGL